MGKKDKRIDACIVRAKPFVWPILEHLRGLVHKACQEVEETINGSHAFAYTVVFILLSV